MGLKQGLGLGSYQTAWTILHKLRRAMVCPFRDRLSGAVEVDETYVGGNEPGVHGRQTAQKAIVAVAVEVHEPRGFGRVRLRRVPDASGSSLIPFVQEVVESGAEVRTDGWGGYNGLTTQGYIHTKTVLSASGDPAHVSMPAVHLCFVAPQALVAGNPSGCGSSPSTRSVPGRVHLSIQPTLLPFSRSPVLPAPGAGRPHQSCSLSFHHWTRALIPTCCGRWS